MEYLKKLIPYIKPHIRRLIVGMIGMGIFTVLSLLPPLLMRYLINDVVQPKQWEFLLPVIGLIVIIPTVYHGINFFNTRIIMRAAYGLISDMRMAMYGKILNLSMRFHGEHSSGILVNRLMDDVNMFQYLVTGQTISILVNLTVFIFSVTIAFTLSPLLALILCVILVLYVLVYRFFSRRIKSSSTAYRTVYDRISERLQETVAGVRHVRIFNREFWENDVFLERTSESLRHALVARVNSVGLSTLCNLIAGFGSAAIAGIGAYFVLSKRLQYGDVLAINTYIWMALNPAIALTTMAGQLTEAMVSVRRVEEILDEKIEIVSPPETVSLTEPRGDVSFRHVYFSYTPDVPLYKDLSLHINPGTTVALVGQTGCGKTSLTTLLMRYWDATSGEICIDGVDIRTIAKKELRNLFGVVLQDPILFDGTLSENISYGFPGASREMIEESARTTEIWDMAMKLPDGFDTFIGTRGVKLSLGEKQRVSIARAILKNPLILIMDEATSSLDSESEALIQKALDRVLIGRTSFVIAHRLSTIINADLIVAMDAGKIVEKGTHTELLKIPNGQYRKLYEELQNAMKAVDAEASREA